MSEPEAEPPAAPQSDSELLAEVRDLLTEIRDVLARAEPDGLDLDAVGHV